MESHVFEQCDYGLIAETKSSYMYVLFFFRSTKAVSVRRLSINVRLDYTTISHLSHTQTLSLYI